MQKAMTIIPDASDKAASLEKNQWTISKDNDP